MPSSSEIKQPTPILVEFVRGEEISGLQPVGIRDWFKRNKPGLEKKSNAAVDKGYEHYTRDVGPCKLNNSKSPDKAKKR